jgi:hypothetical protein
VAGGDVSLIHGVPGGGGILEDAIVVLRNPHFVMSNTVPYGKNMQKVAPLFAVTTTETLEDGSELDHEQFISLGGVDDFIPSDDGLGLNKIGTKPSIVEDSNFLLFITSIMDAGFPTERIKSEHDITFLDGLKCHVTKKVKERKGLDKKEQSYLFVDKIYLDEKQTGKRGVKAGTGAGAGAGKSAPTEVDEALIEEAKSSLLELLYSDAIAEAGGIAKNKMIAPLLAIIKKNPKVKELTKIILSDEFLVLQEGWVYEKGMITTG